MHVPSDDESDKDGTVAEEWQKFRNEQETMVNDNTIVLCSLLLMESLLPMSGYSKRLRRRLRERITVLKKRYVNNSGGTL
jgi:hypothetical protein